jgi:hypothetical protein
VEFLSHRVTPVLLTCLNLAAGLLHAQNGVKLYEHAVETVAAAFPDAARPGSTLHVRIGEAARDMERKNDPAFTSPGRPVIAVVRAAAQLQRERPEAAPNPLGVAARSLAVIEKEYGALNAPSAFARTFWELVPEVRANLPDFNSTGAWPLAAGALAELRLAGSPGTRTGAGFQLHQGWLAVGGGSEWPPKSGTVSPEKLAVTQTGPETWQTADGLTITRASTGRYEVTK